MSEEMIPAPETASSAQKPPLQPTSLLLGIGGIVVVVLIVLIGIFATKEQASAAGLSVSEPPGADYFPDSTTFYVGLRTDEELLADLGTVYAALREGIVTALQMPPEAATELPEEFPALLDQLTQDALGEDDPNATFETSVRSWLGDTAVMGGTIDENGEMGSPLLVIDITDHDAAVAFFDTQLIEQMDEYQREEVNDAVLYIGEDQAIAVTNNAILVAENREALPLTDKPEANLADNNAFQTAMRNLPEDNYDVLFYLDSEALLEQALAEAPTETPVDAIMTQLLDSFGALAFGATLQDNQSLIVDVGTTVDWNQLEDQFGLVTTPAIDTGFWRYIPQDATLVLQGAGLATAYNGMVGLFQTDPESAEQFTQLAEQLERATTLNLQEDILSWMDGDYALFFTYNITPEEPGFLVTAYDPEAPIADLGMEFGVVIETTDAEKAAHFVDTIAPLLSAATAEDQTATVTREEIAGANAIVIAITVPENQLALEFVIGANDDVFVAGTRAAATAALQGRGNFQNASLFRDAREFLLDDPYELLYMDRNTITMVGDVMLVISPSINNVFANIVGSLSGEEAPYYEESTPPTREEVITAMGQVRDLAALFDSFTLSATTDADGNTQLRMVLTIAK